MTDSTPSNFFSSTRECPEHGDSCVGEECCCKDKHPPVAPAPTASEEFEDWDDAAQEWLSEHFHSTADGGVWRRKADGKCFMVTELMEMYASSQSSKLEGVGQEAVQLANEEKARKIAELVADVHGTDGGITQATILAILNGGQQ